MQFSRTERQILGDWLCSQLNTLSVPDLLVNLFAERDCIVELSILQRVRASLREVSSYMVRAELGVLQQQISVLCSCVHRCYI